MRFKKFYATVSELARNYSHQNAFHLLHRLPHPTELHSNHRFKPLAQFEIDDFIKFEEPQTEPLDLSMTRMIEKRIGPSDLSLQREPLDLSMSRTHMGIHKFEEPQTELLDLSMTRMIERRIGPSDLSAPEISGGQVELSEIDQNDARPLNLSVQEVSKEQTNTGIEPKTLSLQKEISRLEEHTTNTPKTSFKCKTCGKGFARSSDMKKHVRIHTGDRPFKCEICGKDFRRLWDLRLHKRTHTGDKPYKCETCWMGFAHSSNMRAHMKTHTGDKSYKCRTCEKNFAQSSGLSRHMRTHSGP
ncbi:zinc finger protein [Loa loa]|uniref:Zinc finger protein n=1 Tax=Loa loa TaxID=7209 RepID=A0A1S0UCS6_LOALO|nr:zinc finger protein [Loa loa]EJD73389.1 zinc finger protein [Loa loa]